MGILDDKVYKIKANLFDGLDCDDIIFYQNDTKQSKIEVDFYGAKNKAIDVSNCIVTCVIDKADKTQVVEYMECDSEVNNRASCTLTVNSLATVGKNNKISIIVYGEDGERQTFGTCKFKVNKDINNGGVESTSEYPILTQLISDTRNAKNEVEALKDDIVNSNNTAKANEEVRVAKEKERQANEVNRVDKFEQIKKDYETYKKVMIDESPAANLQAQINENSAQLDNIAINVFSYKDDVVIINGQEDWKYAFDKAFSQLQSGGTLLIPPHEYYISSRCILENKNGITINCGGTIKPINSKVPLIGVITIRNVRDCVINNMNLDGNKDGITPTGKFGTHSMLCIDNSKNVILNNIKISNTYESGVTSNGNLENVIINNIEFDNIGEHGFYLSGSNIRNIKFNNIIANNIGMSEPNFDRAVAVIKFRNKINEDLLHDNIIVDGFEFNNNARNTWVDGNTRDFIQAWDCKNVSIKNGKIKGDNTCVFQTNLSIDNLTVDNVKFDGKFFAYGIKNISGLNEPTILNEYGNSNIKFINCDLKGGCKYISLLNFENSTIENNDNLNDDMIDDSIIFPNKSCKINNCLIKPTNRRIDLKFANEIIFNNVKFLELNTGSQPLINLNLKENSNVVFENVISNDEISLFLQSSSAIFVKFTNCYINGFIKSTVNLKELEIINCKLKEYRLNIYSSYDKLKVNSLYDLSNRRMDSGIYNATIKATQTTTNLSLKYNRVEDINLNKLLITNNKNIPFTVSCNDNILTFTIESQTSDVVFTVFYNA